MKNLYPQALRLAAVAVCCSALNGCFLLLVGGAAEGGYVAGQKEKPSTTVSDQWITTKVKTALIADSEIKARNINVVTSDGVVTLRGIVFSPKEQERAAAAAQKIKGVKKVVNYLKLTE